MSPNVDGKKGLRAVDKATEFESGNVLQSITSIEQASLAELDDSRNGKFHRSFSPRQIHVGSTQTSSTFSSTVLRYMELTIVLPRLSPSGPTSVAASFSAQAKP